MSDENLKYLLDKMTELRETIGDTNVILERNTATLEVHVKRTALLEERVKPLESVYNNVQGIVFWVKVVGVVIPAIIAGRTLGLY